MYFRWKTREYLWKTESESVAPNTTYPFWFSFDFSLFTQHIKKLMEGFFSPSPDEQNASHGFVFCCHKLEILSDLLHGSTWPAFHKNRLLHTGALGQWRRWRIGLWSEVWDAVHCFGERLGGATIEISPKKEMLTEMELLFSSVGQNWRKE